jgi:hypothetical protein
VVGQAPRSGDVLPCSRSPRSAVFHFAFFLPASRPPQSR